MKDNPGQPQTTPLPVESDKVLVEFEVLRTVNPALIKVGKGNIQFWLSVEVDREGEELHEQA